VTLFLLWHATKLGADDTFQCASSQQAEMAAIQLGGPTVDGGCNFLPYSNHLHEDCGD
jgi:hypothetical protein